MVTAKLFVAAGAPVQVSAGDVLPPVHPIPLKTCALASFPSLISVLEILKPWAERTDPDKTSVATTVVMDRIAVFPGLEGSPKVCLGKAPFDRGFRRLDTLLLQL